MIKCLVNPVLNGPLDIREIVYHPTDIKLVRLDAHLDSSVVAVQMPTLPVIIEQSVPVTKINMLCDAEHASRSRNQATAVHDQRVARNKIAAFNQEQHGVHNVSW